MEEDHKTSKRLERIYSKGYENKRLERQIKMNDKKAKDR
jgi:hypothetical protein